ncbi:MAG: hypothetical protein K2K38_05675 [Clostridia bacterium]|nr:hypothetical protein [Clostridia bacterium]
MAKTGFIYKTVKIKPENKVTAEGYVEGVKLSSTSKTSILFMTKYTLNYKVSIRVDGVSKPLTLKVCNKLGWGVAIAADIEAYDGAYRGFPLQIGDKLNVEYDRVKPSKCNKVD